MDEEVPQELREKIQNMLDESGKTKQFEDKLLSGIKDAVVHLKTGKDTVVVKNEFEDNSELLALQYIYSYLQKKNLAYTFSTILLESRIPENNKKQYDLPKVINFISQPLDENDNLDVNIDDDLEVNIDDDNENDDEVKANHDNVIEDHYFEDNNDDLIAEIADISNSEDVISAPKTSDPKKPAGESALPTKTQNDDDDDFLLDSQDDIIQPSETTPKKPTPQSSKAPAKDSSGDDDNDFFLDSESDDIKPPPTKPNNQSIKPKQNDDEFEIDDFDEISDDYIAQGDEITSAEFNKNDIITKVSDL